MLLWYTWTALHQNIIIGTHIVRCVFSMKDMTTHPSSIFLLYYLCKLRLYQVIQTKYCYVGIHIRFDFKQDQKLFRIYITNNTNCLLGQEGKGGQGIQREQGGFAKTGGQERE